MKHLLLLPMALILAGCTARIEIDPNSWMCTQIGQYTEDSMMIAGSAAMPTTVTKTGCVQWSRVQKVAP